MFGFLKQQRGRGRQQTEGVWGDVSRMLRPLHLDSSMIAQIFLLFFLAGLMLLAFVPLGMALQAFVRFLFKRRGVLPKKTAN
jgi:hypothetical protein